MKFNFELVQLTPGKRAKHLGMVKYLGKSTQMSFGLNSKTYLREVVKKTNGLFTVRLTVRGGGWSAPSALTVSKCENFGPIFPIIKW